MAQSILLPTGSWKPRVWIDSWISNRHDDAVDGCLHNTNTNRQSLSYVSAVTGCHSIICVTAVTGMTGCLPHTIEYDCHVHDIRMQSRAVMAWTAAVHTDNL